jgi:hypothetical protein
MAVYRLDDDCFGFPPPEEATEETLKKAGDKS